MCSPICVMSVEKKYFLEWAKTEEFRQKVQNALGVIRKAILIARKPYVAVSGGKDSLTVLHLVSKVKPDVDVWHWDHGLYLMPREIEKEIVKTIFSMCSPKQVVLESSSRLGEEAARWDYKRWYRAFYGTLYRVVKERGWDLCFLGIRAEESHRRKVKYDFFVAGEMTICCPIFDWSWRDVWAYIISNNIKYPKVYDKLVELVGWKDARLTTFFDYEFAWKMDLDQFILWKEKII